MYEDPWVSVLDFQLLISKLFRSSLNFPLVRKLTWQMVQISWFLAEKVSPGIYSTGLHLCSLYIYFTTTNVVVTKAI